MIPQLQNFFSHCLVCNRQTSHVPIIASSFDFLSFGVLKANIICFDVIFLIVWCVKGNRHLFP